MSKFLPWPRSHIPKIDTTIFQVQKSSWFLSSCLPPDICTCSPFETLQGEGKKGERQVSLLLKLERGIKF